MKTTIASTNDAAVERNVSRSDMDKIHVIVAEINKLVTLYENLATYQLVYEKSDELKAFAEVYPSWSVMFPKVEAVYPHLGAIDTLSEMTPRLLNLEVLAEQVSFNTDIVKHDAIQVGNYKQELDVMYADIVPKYNTITSEYETIMQQSLSVTEKFNFVSGMKSYIETSIIDLNNLLSQIVDVAPIAAQVANDKVIIKEYKDQVISMYACINPRYIEITNDYNKIKIMCNTINSTYTAICTQISTINNQVSQISSFATQVSLDKSSVQNYCLDVLHMSNGLEDTLYTTAGGQSVYSAKHYMLKAKSYAESTGASVGDFSIHTTNMNNPHNVTKEQIGLGLVENIRSADANVKSAQYLANTRTISLIGEATGTIPFDGKANVSMNVSVPLKTINGQDLHGTGNIIISGGAGGSSSNWYDIINTPTTLSGYGITDVYSKIELDTKFATKQNALVSGTSIKTILGQSLLGSGDLTLSVKFSDVINKPTTLAGYGINNAYTKSETDLTLATLLATKIDKIAGKGLSSNDFTDNYKAKIDSSLAYVHPDSTAVGTFNKVVVNNLGHVIDGFVSTDINDLGITNVFTKTETTDLVSTKVEKVVGKSLTSNDFTDEYKIKLDNSVAYVHPNSDVAPGIYTKVTVDNKGHIVSGSNPTTIDGYNITDAMTTNHAANVIIGLGSSGSSNLVARADHTHDSDNTKVSKTDSIYIGTTAIIMNSTSGSINELDVDILGNASTASKLSNVVSINDVVFDGTTSIVIEDNTKQDLNSNLTSISSFATGSHGTLIRQDDDTWILSAVSSRIDTITGSGAIDVVQDDTIVISIKPATNTYEGSMSATDKAKLDTVETSANNYIHPSSGISAGEYTVLNVNSTGHIVSGSKPTNISALGITNVYSIEDINLLLNNYQSLLESGTNIKTVNGQSILGTGNLSVTTDISSIPFTSIAGLPTTIAEYGVTNVYTKTEVDNRISQKQDALLSGSNIKTINGISIIGGGNINIAGGVTSVAGRTGVVVLTKNDVGLDLVTNISDGSRNVLSATKLTTPRNINGIAFDGTSDITIPVGNSFSGSYTDLTNKPTIPTIPINVSYFSNDAGYLTNTYHDSTKQNSLVSGTNIKTINGISLLGSGDITISGGSGGLINFSESVCNVGTTSGQNILTPNTLCTNADIILMPKGKGSIARVPALNTVTSVTRGCNSVDLATHGICRYGSMNGSHYSTSSGGVDAVNDKSPYGVIAGGVCNYNCSSYAGVISGGVLNSMCTSQCSSISGGYDNHITGSVGASITGGIHNVISCSASASIKSGDNNNINTSNYSSIGGGTYNNITSTILANISGGGYNNIYSSLYANILGGAYNTVVSSQYATILGGYCNAIYSATVVDRYALLYGKCGQIGTSDSTTLFALAYGTSAVSSSTQNYNLIYCVDNVGINYVKGICALSGFKLTGLPTTNPGVGTGLLWNNAGILSIA